MTLCQRFLQLWNMGHNRCTQSLRNDNLVSHSIVMKAQEDNDRI
jgi:hypothetical protein